MYLTGEQRCYAENMLKDELLTLMSTCSIIDFTVKV